MFRRTEPSQAPLLEPVNPPLGPQPPDQRFYSPNQVVLQLQEKMLSLTSNDFTIRTVEGMDVMRCTGKVFSMHGKKAFTDMQGQEIFTLNNKIMTLWGSFFAESPQGYNFEIKGKFKLVGSKSEVHFRNASTGQDVTLQVRGDWIGRKAEIMMNDIVVASVMQKMFNARNILGDAQTYFVAVAPNVDLSMIAAVCISIDEREKSH